MIAKDQENANVPAPAIFRMLMSRLFLLYQILQFIVRPEETGKFVSFLINAV